MPSLSVDANPGSNATFIPDETISLAADAGAVADLEAMGDVCFRLLQILSKSAQDSASPETYSQLDLVRFACDLLLQVLGSPYNVSNADPHKESQVFTIYRIYPHDPGFARAIYYQLLRVYVSFDESDATLLGGNQVLDSAVYHISQVIEDVTSWHSNLLTCARRVALAALKFVLVACHQLLQVYGIQPCQYNTTQLEDRQVLANNAYQIQLTASETVQPTAAREDRVPLGGDTSGRLRCRYKDCEATYGRRQELKRHRIDVHTQRRLCPFCSYKWTRPDKIKNHLMENHQDNLEPQFLDEIDAMRGRDLVAFLAPLCAISE